MVNIHRFNDRIIKKYGVSYGLTIVDLDILFPIKPGILENQSLERNFMSRIDMLGDKRIFDFFQSLLNLISDEINGLFINHTKLDFYPKRVDKSKSCSVNLHLLSDLFEFSHDSQKILSYSKRSLNCWVIQPSQSVDNVAISEIDNQFNIFFKSSRVYRIKNTLLYFQLVF
jgi:hypothetical protein